MLYKKDRKKAIIKSYNHFHEGYVSAKTKKKRKKLKTFLNGRLKQ